MGVGRVSSGQVELFLTSKWGWGGVLWAGSTFLDLSMGVGGVLWAGTGSTFLDL